MITKEFSLEQMPDYPFDKDYDINKILFFDIETTGFSSDTSYLYLIGCAFFKNSSFHMIQWFSDGISEEPLLLTSFFEFAKNYQVILHYNGSGFDLPYLQRKCHQHQLDYSFDSLLSIDIYKRILPYKKILKLDSLKQRSLETFLKIKRKDVFGGGELIPIYQSYLGKKYYEKLTKFRRKEVILPSPTESDLLLGQLLLHNEDDIRGLLRISPILNYVDLFEKPIRILKASVEGKEFHVHFEISASLPVGIEFKNDLAHVSAYDNMAHLTLQIYEGELKHFYDNYKDYYYLPAEDRAIHKSLAQFVDKDFRIKAKPSTSYTKKKGVFAPQYEMVISPCFKINHTDKLSFLEIHTDFLLQEEILELYVHHVLNFMRSKL